MQQLVPYINFDGRCREALVFYQALFENADVSIQTFGDGPQGLAPKDSDAKVLHAEFKAGNVFFMATDGQPAMPVERGNNIHLSLQLGDKDLQNKIFDGLSQGGQVTMPLQDTFWHARFGMVTDQFGLHWMLNVPGDA